MLKRSLTQIEHLDVQIQVPDHLIPIFQIWLDDFSEYYDYVTMPPKLKVGRLQVNSRDLIEFTGYMEPDKLSEVDRQRFLRQVHEQLTWNLNKSLSSDTQYHYKWCLAALAHLPLGRHL